MKPIIIYTSSLILFVPIYNNIRHIHAEEPQVETSETINFTSDFRQLTNQEFAQYFYQKHEAGVNSTSTESTIFSFSEFTEERMKVIQSKYDDVLLILSSERGYNERDLSKIDRSFLKQLEWMAETNKNSYEVGEPIELYISLRNISNKEVTFSKRPLTNDFILVSIELKKTWNNKLEQVELTRSGFASYLFRLPNFPWRPPRLFGVVKLQPGEKGLTNQSLQTINQYYDLSHPGEYELTFYTRNFQADDEHQIGEYPKPCTIRFTIVDKIENNKQP
jgi:hypothetical protein